MDHLRVLSQLGQFPSSQSASSTEHVPVPVLASQLLPAWCAERKDARTDPHALQGCLLLFLGRLADLFGRKITFIAGCVVMGVFGLGCGFAQGMYAAPRSRLPSGLRVSVRPCLRASAAMCLLEEGVYPEKADRAHPVRSTSDAFVTRRLRNGSSFQLAGGEQRDKVQPLLAEVRRSAEPMP